MRIVHFGAGNIGRGAIPEIFYGIYSHITFIDQNKELVDRINNTKSYRIINSKEIVISNYNAIIISDIDEMLLEIQKADLITTSCGINNLEKIADILNRIHNLKTKPIVIAFENNIRPSSYLKSFVENTKWFYIFRLYNW